VVEECDVFASLGVRSAGDVVGVVRDYDGEYLLLAAGDDLRQGVRCRPADPALFVELAKAYTDLGSLPPGSLVTRADHGLWRSTPLSGYSHIEDDGDEEVRWLREAESTTAGSADCEPLLATTAVLAGHRVTSVSHAAEGEWYFLSAADQDAEELDVKTVSWDWFAESDPSVLDTRSLLPGWTAERTKPGSWASHPERDD
jgi:hypothetical protein